MAIIDFGRRRAAPTGMAVFIGMYVTLVLSMPGTEFDPYRGDLPTTRALRLVFKGVAEYFHPDIRTGKLSPAKSVNPWRITSNKFDPYTHETPSRHDFMTIGHCLWALLLGYFGGHFARWVYARRLREQERAEVAAG